MPSRLLLRVGDPLLSGDQTASRISHTFAFATGLTSLLSHVDVLQAELLVAPEDFLAVGRPEISYL